MSIKGFKSQQALQQKLRGYTEEQSVDQARYVTVQEMPGRRHAIDSINHGAFKVNALVKIAEAGSNIRTIICTGHGANVNDMIRLSNGTELSALSVPDANTIITSVELLIDPTGDTFDIYRYITPLLNPDGTAPSQLSLGTAITGSIMPAGGVSNIGWLSAIYTKLTQSIVVTGTFWQSIQPVSTAAIIPTYLEILNLTNAMQTFTVPVNAKWVLVQADGSNPDNIRAKAGGSASAVSGHQLQAGRDMTFNCGGDITVFSESNGSNKVYLTYGV